MELEIVATFHHSGNIISNFKYVIGSITIWNNHELSFYDDIIF